jgi:hypothetical protein
MILFPILVIIYWAVPYTREQSHFHLVSHCDGCSTKYLPFFEALRVYFLDLGLETETLVTMELWNKNDKIGFLGFNLFKGFKKKLQS